MVAEDRTTPAEARREDEALCEIPLTSLRESGFVARVVEGREILVVDTGSGIRVYSGICPHLGGPLLEGEVDRDRIRCPWHGYEFDARSGRCQTIPGRPWKNLPGRRPEAPADLALRRLPFSVDDGVVRVFRS